MEAPAPPSRGPFQRSRCWEESGIPLQGLRKGARAPRRPRAAWLWNGLLLALSGFVALALAEAALRLATPFPVDDPAANTVPDRRLGHRMDPSLDGIDERGFRNPPGIEGAAVAAIGDSHTYGYNVPSPSAWPARLAERIERPVYNLGIAGFGVLQYRDLVPEALALHPEHVLMALYLANDLVSVCGYSRIPHWKERVTGTEVGRRLLESCRVLTRPDGRPLEEPPRARTGDASLAQRTALGSALRHLVWLPLESELWIRGFLHRGDRGRLRIDDRRNGMLVSLTRLRTHTLYMDLARPEVAALADLSKDTLLAMRRQLHAGGAAFGAMLVPTRERVIYRYLLDRGVELPPAFHRLVEVEEAAVADFLAFFAEAGIAAVDLAPYVSARLVEGGVYPRREDGHPLAPGYEAYARGAYETFFAPPGSAPPLQ